MITFEIETKSRAGKVIGPKQFRVKTVKELEDFVIGNHILLSREFLKNEQDKNEFPKKETEFVTIVDNQIDAPDKSVKIFGKTEYVTKLDNISDVILAAMRLVAERSPTATGFYQANNVLFYNGKIVAKGIIGASAWLKRDRNFKASDRFRIVNLSPYARKLERRGVRRGTAGKVKGRTHRTGKKGKNKAGKDIALPNGAYILSQRVLKSRFPTLKNNIRFSFIPIAPTVARQAPMHGRDTMPFGTFKSEGKGKGRPYLYPSISISIRPQSFSLNAGFTEQGGNL